MLLGQLLMVGFNGLEPDAHIEAMIREERIGGVILFRRNLESPAQVAALTARLQEINRRHSDIPLLIALDQEGDMARRFDGGVTPLPPAMLFRNQGSPDDCRALHRVVGTELRAMGINLNLAPVLDVNSNPANPVIGVRAFGETVAEVERYGLAALAGLHEGGVRACGKHFPGHGDTTMDSHDALPSVPHARNRLDELELAPFRAAFRQGLDAVMTAHVRFPAIEPDDLPATLSRRVLTDLLRGRMGFDGVVLTDCMAMAAILEHHGIVRATPMAVAAGADIVLVSHHPALQRQAAQALRDALDDGSLTRVEAQTAIERVLRLKTRLAGPAALAHGFQAPQGMALAERVYRDGMYRRGTPAAIDPAVPTLLISFAVRDYAPIDQLALGGRSMPAEDLLPHFRAAGIAAEELALPPAPDAAQVEQALVRIGRARQVVVQTYDACRHPSQLRIVQAVPAAALWLLAGRLPYDLDAVPAARARLGVCSNRPWAQRILLERIGVRARQDATDDVALV